MAYKAKDVQLAIKRAGVALDETGAVSVLPIPLDKGRQVAFPEEAVGVAVRAALDGLVSEEERKDELDERYQAGKDAMRVKSAQVADAVAILEDAKALIGKAISWSGPADWQDRATRRLDDLIETLSS